MMRPIKITMSGFICFAKEQVIDFDKLGKNGIYLITGSTGAGKTTIFDAISYALYGEASGASRDRPTKLRSEYLTNDEKTFVNFEFESAGKVYKILREIKPQVNRETKEITKLNEGVVLELPSGIIITKDKEVKAKIEEIVGLNKDQFSQIIMIAQNDFLRFLTSGTDNRVNILRHIFNTNHIKSLQERLKKLRNGADEALQLVKRDFESRGVNPYEREKALVDIKGWIEDWKKQLKLYNEGIKKQAVEEKKLAAEIAVAEGVSKLFRDLREVKLLELKHAEQKDGIEALKIKKERGEVALYKIKPVADKYDVQNRQRTAAVNGLAQATAEVDNVNKALQEVIAKISSFPNLEEVELAYLDLEKKHTEAVERLEKLVLLKTKSDELLERKRNLVLVQEEVSRLHIDFELANKSTVALYERFIKSQAGFLAMQLKEGEPCFVCGSTKHPSLATIADESVNEQELNRLRSNESVAKKKLDAKSLECAGLIAEIKTLENEFKKSATKVVENKEIDFTEAIVSEIEELKLSVENLRSEINLRKANLEKLKMDITNATKSQNNNTIALAAATALVEERNKQVVAIEQTFQESKKELDALLVQHKFSKIQEYQDAVLTDVEIAEISKLIVEYDEKGKQIKHDIQRLVSDTKDKQEPNIEILRVRERELENISNELREQHVELSSKIDQHNNLIKFLTETEKKFIVAEKRLLAVKGLSDVANGKLDFETYVQIAYFERILSAANLRLKSMSQGRYVLLRKSIKGDGRQKMGLEIDVFDAHTGRPRSTDSLSGGESFLASLSLALGLSDVVQQNAGSIHIDTMFIDEGFGSLDAETLDLSIRTLSDMAGANRSIGIISHVQEMQERIDKRIIVVKSQTGSSIEIVV